MRLVIIESPFEYRTLGDGWEQRAIEQELATKTVWP